MRFVNLTHIETAKGEGKAVNEYSVQTEMEWLLVPHEICFSRMRTHSHSTHISMTNCCHHLLSLTAHLNMKFRNSLATYKSKCETNIQDIFLVALNGGGVLGGHFV